MKETIIKSTPHMLRHYRSNTHWYIPHSAGRLKITLIKTRPQAIKYIAGATYYKNATTTVSVTSEEEFAAAMTANKNVLYYDNGDIQAKWILPDGTIVEGLSVDTAVPAGETLCICSDFYACGLDMSECDIAGVVYRDLPPFQGTIHMRSYQKEPTAISEIPHQTSVLGVNRVYYTGGYRCVGTPSSPSNTHGTVKDIDGLFTGTWRTKIWVQYAPHIIGDLADITAWCQKRTWTIWGTSTERTYEPEEKTPYTSETTRDFTYKDTMMSFHHCDVHGVPDIARLATKCIDWEYYACPNAKPEDFDGLIDALFEHWYYTLLATNPAVDGVGFVWSSSSGDFTPSLTCLNESCFLMGYSYEAGKPFIGAYGTLKISNRTADPIKRAEKLAILRAAGWQVEEVDDSLEDGIYAAI